MKCQTSWTIYYYDFSKIKGIKEFQKIKILTARQMSVLLQYAFNKEAIQKLINQLPDFLQKVYKSDLKLLIKLNLLDKNHNLTSLGEKVLYWYFIWKYADLKEGLSEPKHDEQYKLILELPAPWLGSFGRYFNKNITIKYSKLLIFDEISATEELQNKYSFLLKHKILEKLGDKYYPTRFAQDTAKRIPEGFFGFTRAEGLVDINPKNMIKGWINQRNAILARFKDKL